MSARLVKMSKADVESRATHARAFLTAADLIVGLGGDTGIEQSGNLIGSLAVLAGIAAADAICGHTLGERAGGENHVDAVALLRRGTAVGDKSAAQLKRLLDVKTTTQYSPVLIGDGKAAQLLEIGRRLVDRMEDLLRV